MPGLPVLEVNSHRTLATTQENWNTLFVLNINRSTRVTATLRCWQCKSRSKWYMCSSRLGFWPFQYLFAISFSHLLPGDLWQSKLINPNNHIFVWKLGRLSINIKRPPWLSGNTCEKREACASHGISGAKHIYCAAVITGKPGRAAHSLGSWIQTSPRVFLFVCVCSWHTFL